MANAKHDFRSAAAAALADRSLQKALLNVKRGFVAKRAAAKAKLPEFDTLREEARAIKDHTLSHLDLYLEAYERKVIESGGEVHYAPAAAEARAIVLKLCEQAGAKLVTKGKSMVSEEIGLNEHLQAAKIDVVETDLGEYIVQLRGERPSHIIAPAIHLNKETIEHEFRRKHARLPRERRLDRAEYLVAEARALLREKFLAADVGVTGANLLIAETGSSVIVTNEGNGDLTATLPRLHIVIASIEKLVPTLEDASTILRLLARSATGQEITTYTSFFTGPRREGDPDGPTAYHVVLLDNGRSEMLGNEFADMLTLYPLRRLPQSLPGLWRDRRACLRLDLSRPDGRGADAAARRHRPRARPSQRFELLWTLRGGLSDGDSPPRHDAVVAGARLCPRQPAPLRTAHAEALGIRGKAAAPLPCACRGDGAVSRAARGRAWAIEPVAADAGLDRDARSPRPARQDLPAALWAADAKGCSMSAPDDARSIVMGRIRASLGVASLDRARKASVERRLERHARGTVPSRAKGDRAERVALFTAMLVAQGADVRHVPTRKEAVAAIASYLGTCNLPPRIRMGRDAKLAMLPWRDAWDIERSIGPAGPGDQAALSRAVVAAAETGTLFLVSGPANPTTLNFLPEAHTVLIEVADIVGSHEEAWDRLRTIHGEGSLPRAVNLISGPSRTADIEQTIVRGAHGPRRLLVLILG